MAIPAICTSPRFLVLSAAHYKNIAPAALRGGDWDSTVLAEVLDAHRGEAQRQQHG